MCCFSYQQDIQTSQGQQVSTMLGAITCEAMFHQQELPAINELRGMYNNSIVAINDIEYKTGVIKFTRFISKSFNPLLSMYTGILEFVDRESETQIVEIADFTPLIIAMT